MEDFIYEKDADGIVTVTMDMQGQGANTMNARFEPGMRVLVGGGSGGLADFGTFPATKAIPKEMLAIVDRPLIQYAVDEAREAGIEQMIFVTGRGKGAIEDHFDHSYELQAELAARGKTAWEIGRILGISEATAVRHLKQARERYGVDKQTSLLMEALVCAEGRSGWVTSLAGVSPNAARASRPPTRPVTMAGPRKVPSNPALPLICPNPVTSPTA